MRKNRAPAYEGATPRVRSPWLVLRHLLLVAAVAPFFYEFGTICYSRWMVVLGRRMSPSTPVLDQIGLFLQAIRSHVMAAFRRVPWRPEYVLVVGIVSCALCMMLLRGRQPR